MTMQDPIADLCTRIRNAQAVTKEYVVLPSSKIKKSITDILLSEGFINSFEEIVENKHKMLKIFLKYGKKQVPVINMIKRVSRPGLRNYKGKNDLPEVPGFGVAIVSTSKGLMTAKHALAAGVGGEVICVVN